MQTALLLEDEPLIAMDLEITLQGGGFDVVHMVTCADADQWLHANRADIAIVDIHLQDGSCHDVVGKLHAAGIPFVVHSGSHPSEHAGTPFEHGVWLSKPSIATDLIEAVTRAVAPD